MKKTGLFKIIMFILLGLVVTTWIFSSSYFNEGALTELGMNNIGFFDYFSLLFASFQFQYFIQIFTLLLSIGALYGVLAKTGKYRAWVEKIASKCKGKELVFLILTALVIAIISSVFDYGFAFVIVIPFLLSIILAMGYDKITAIITTFGAMLIGTIGNTIGYSTSGVIADLASIKATDGIFYKLALFLLGFGLLVLFLSKAKKVKSTSKNEDIEDIFIGEKTSSKYSLAPIITILSIVLGLLVLGCTKWTVGTNFIYVIVLLGLGFIISMASLVYFDNNTKKVKSYYLLIPEAILLFALYLFLGMYIKNPIINIVIVSIIFLVTLAIVIFVKKFKKVPVSVIVCLAFVAALLLTVRYGNAINNFDFAQLHDTITNYSIKLPYFHITNDGISTGTEKIAIFGKILGTVNPFGEWYYAEMTVICVLAALVLSLFYRINNKFETMAEGAIKILKPAFMVLLTYSIIYFAGMKMFFPTIAKIILSISSKFSIILSSIVTAIGSALHVDILYVANYVVPQTAANASNKILVGILTQSIYGLSMFIAPTSALIVFGLTYLNIPYKDWVKKTWKLVLSLLALIVVILVIIKFI